MTSPRQVLFVQGGGAGAHDEWDAALVENLRQGLGDSYDVSYPRMPDEGDPSYARWSAAIREELAALDDGALVVGHSLGATVLVNALAQQAPARQLGAIVLIAAPFVGEGGWPADGFEPTVDLGGALPPGVPVFVFHGLDDGTVPLAHAELYARTVPQARVHLLPGRDHQLNGDLGEVAHAVRVIDEEPRVVSADRLVAASSAAIFELIADPSRQPEWDGNDNLVQAPAGQRVTAVGDVFTMTLTTGGVRDNHVVEFAEGRRIAWRPSEPGRRPPGHLWRWELEPVDESHTSVVHTYDWTLLTDQKRLERARRTTSASLSASLDRLAALAALAERA